MTVRLRNIFGGAETLEGNISAGTKTRRAFQGSVSAPLLWADPTLRTYGTLAISGVRRDNSSFSSASEDSHMLRASVRVRSVVPHEWGRVWAATDENLFRRMRSAWALMKWPTTLLSG